MNAGLKLAMACGVAGVLTAKSGQGTSEGGSTGRGQPAEAAVPAVAKPAVPQDAVIRIKGLYVGMGGTEAQKIFADLLKDFQSFEDVPRMRSFTRDSVNVMWQDIGVEGGKYFGFAVRCHETVGQGYYAEDADGQVTGFGFDSNLVASLFDPKDLPYADFSRKFAAAYNIPELKESAGNLFQYYESRSGVRFEIWLGKSLVVRRIAVGAAPNRK